MNREFCFSNAFCVALQPSHSCHCTASATCRHVEAFFGCSCAIFRDAVCAASFLIFILSLVCLPVRGILCAVLAAILVLCLGVGLLVPKNQTRTKEPQPIV